MNISEKNDSSHYFNPYTIFVEKEMRTSIMLTGLFLCRRQKCGSLCLHSKPVTLVKFGVKTFIRYENRADLAGGVKTYWCSYTEVHDYLENSLSTI